MEEIEFALKTFFFNGEGLVVVCKQKKKVNQIPNILDSPFPFFKKEKDTVLCFLMSVSIS